MVFRSALFALFVFVVNAGCSSQPKSIAKYQETYDFGAISFYSLFARNSQFSEYQNISDGTRNSIELAIEKSFELYGYSYRQPNEADVIISYHLINVPKELSKYNQGVKYCAPCLRAGTEKYSKQPWKMHPGSLVLDIVSQDGQRSIWRSVQPLKIKPKDNSFEVQEKIELAVKTMLRSLPSSS